MSGPLNWSGTAAPIWHTNQPHLYFYLLALWGRIFGFGAPAMHALQSAATLACVLLMHRLARLVAGPLAVWATAMLVLGPAFIVEQNLMVDVPLLAVWLAFFVLLIGGIDDARQTRRYGLAGLACGAALLIKYSSLVLFPILCLSLLLERRRAQVWTAAIPVTMLLAWSVFNLLDYGGVHIAARPHGAGHDAIRPLRLAIEWCVGLGALTPLGVIAAVESRPALRERDALVYAALGLGLGVLVASTALGLGTARGSDRLLWLAFAINGALTVLALAPDAMAAATSGPWRLDLRPDAAPRLYLLLWIGATGLFYVLLSPFMAARHVLLVLPPVVLLLARRWGSGVGRRPLRFALALTVLVSAGLCLSDWDFAAFYRSEARRLAASLPSTTSGTVWASGHWGWQWYAGREGFQEVDVRSSKLRPGDLLVVAEDINHQALTQPVRLAEVRTDVERGSLRDLFCTARPARFYFYTSRQGPWSLSRECRGRIVVFRIVAAGGGGR